jgi:hypothetical protein
MTDDPDGFDLMSALPSAELAKLRRRVTFLEAAIVQFLRDQSRLREWFSAGELAALRLPGMPRTASGIARLAQRGQWEHRITRGRGGERVLYHFSDLPRMAFAAFIDLVVRGDLDDQPPPAPASADAFPALPVKGLAAPPRVTRPEATPAWVLPLMRILRGGSASLEDALRDLPAKAPAGTRCPSYEEALDVLRGLGVIAG